MNIKENCLKIKNTTGVIMSLGGDDNCRGDGRRDRLDVIFHSDTVHWEKVEVDFLTDDEREEMECSGVLSVWNNPVKFASLLVRHLGGKYTKEN